MTDLQRRAWESWLFELALAARFRRTRTILREAQKYADRLEVERIIAASRQP